MAFFAERLPVVHIPEQSLIAAMRKHVIHHSGRYQLPFSLTVDTQRMPVQKSCSCLPPLGVVTTGISATAQAVAAQRHVLLAINLTLFAESRATGIAAGSSWFLGHLLHLTI